MANKAIYQRVVQNDTGDIVPGAEYTVTNERTGTPLTIFSSRAGAAKGSPYFADANGVIQFWTDPGELYRVEVTGPSGSYNDRYIEALQLTESVGDVTEGRATTPGAFGFGVVSAAEPVTDLDALIPSGVYRAESSALNLPAAGRAGIVFVTRRLETSSNIRAHQFFMDIDGKVWQRRNVNGVWQEWAELYHTENLNPFLFSGGTDAVCMKGIAVSTTEIWFDADTDYPSNPASISVNGLFDIRNATFFLVQAGVTPLLGSRRSQKKLILTVGGLSGLTVDRPYYLTFDTTASTIEVNL